jgi:DNA-binding transcriptional MerR regulator/mannose-6-phosphate isomerase-like protein (cupin superfamily)
VTSKRGISRCPRGRRMADGNGAVARAVGLSPSTLRAWESAGLSTPQRDAWRRRWYTAAETDRLHEIRLLRDKQRLSLRDIHHHLVERDGNGAEERSPSHTEHRIAQRLKSMRNQLGLTVRQVAERTGLSSSYVSSVENGYTRSVAGLWKLSQAYRANILSFHRTIAGATAAAGSRGAGGTDRYGRSRGRRRAAHAARRGYRAPSLRADAGRQQRRLVPAGGDEFCYVLAGTLGIWLDEEFFRLEVGDCLSFPSTDEHRFVNLASGVTTFLGGNMPSTF